MEDYPRTLQELESLFASEEGCRDYLARLRWPHGFVCPTCKGTQAWWTGRGLWMCGSCGHQTSVTAGTLFQDPRTLLVTWFRAVWWVVSQKNGASALGLQRVLGLGSYRTAWRWLHKLRRAMVRPGKAHEMGFRYFAGVFGRLRYDNLTSAVKKIPTFQVGDLRFGIVICLDSNYFEPARIMAASGATPLFVPTNTGLPHERESRHTSSGQECRYCSGDRQRCFCDSRGRCRTQRRTVSYGSSETVDPDGMVLQSAQTLREDLIVAATPMSPRPGWNAASNAAVMDESARLVGRSRDTVRENNGQST